MAGRKSLGFIIAIIITVFFLGLASGGIGFLQNNIGTVYISGSTRTFYYQNEYPMDLVALIIGGSDSTIYGIAGESLYDYKNIVFGQRLGLAAKVMAERANLLMNKLPNCEEEYSDFAGILTQISLILEDKDYYKNQGKLARLYSLLGLAQTSYESLINKGCEYPI